MPPNGQLAILAGFAIALMALGVWIALRVSQGNPEKREKRRRLHVHRQGRLGDALIVEASDTLLYYTYSVHGVEYQRLAGDRCAAGSAAGRAGTPDRRGESQVFAKKSGQFDSDLRGVERPESGSERRSTSRTA